MAPKKKGGAAKQETPEQLAARRAKAMAMFNTTSTTAGKPAASAAPKVAAPAKAPVATAEPVEDKLASLDVSDAPAEKLGLDGDVFSNGGEDVRKGALAYAASTLGIVGGSLVTSLPTGTEWAKILTMEPTAALVKKAKKEGTSEAAPNGCKICNLKDVAYLFDERGSNAVCWRTKLEGAAEGLGEQPMVRSIGNKKAKITGKDNIMWDAIVAQSGSTLALLPTGHVTVLGGDDATALATSLIDDLIDGDGEKARETLAARLVVAEPWGGVLEQPCPDEWVGAVIGKGGAGIKQIASESGATIDYVEPDEAAAEGGSVDVSDGSGGAAAAAAAAAADGEDGAAAKPTGFFRIRGKFENQCRLAAKRIEERLALVKRLDVHGYVMVPRNVVGRLIGKGGSNVKILQRSSGASRIGFDKEPGGRATTQACTLQATDIETAIGAAKVILEAVPDPNAPLEHKKEIQRRLEDWGVMVGVLRGAERTDQPVADATREMAVEAHRTKFGSACLNSDQQTKERPSELAAVDFDVWALQWAVCTPLRAI
jgi:hypothetical protein